MRSQFGKAFSACVLLGVWLLGTALIQAAPPQEKATDTGMKMSGHQGMILEASKLHDLEVYSNDGKKLGTIKNLIVDVPARRVLCGIVDCEKTGKMVPVPWKAFHVEKKGDTCRLSLNMSEERLKDVPSFSADQRPDFASTEWREKVDKFFGTKLAERVARAREGERPGALSRKPTILECSKIAKLDVYNDQDRKLGRLANAIVDTGTGDVLYVILDTGAGKQILVPWIAMRLQKDVHGADYAFLLRMAPDKLAQAPTYNLEEQPDFTNAEWQQRIDKFFGVRTAARPIIQPEEKVPEKQ